MQGLTGDQLPWLIIGLAWLIVFRCALRILAHHANRAIETHELIRRTKQMRLDYARSLATRFHSED